MPEPVVAVLGATGRTGRPLVSALQRRGAKVRAITRNIERENPFSDAVELRFGQMTDADALASAFAGADSIHYIPPSLDARDPLYVANIIAAAQRAGVPRVVYHSVLHPNTPEMVHHIRKAGSERLFRYSPLAWTVIQPAMYVQTALAYFDPEAGTLSPPYDPTRPFTLIHEEDLAEAAAIIHTSEGHAFATYELAGAEQLDFVAMGERLGEIFGRPIATRKADAEAYVANFARKRGLTASQAYERWLMFDHYDRHGLLGNGNVLRMLLGREPTGFAEAARHSLARTLARVRL